MGALLFAWAAFNPLSGCIVPDEGDTPATCPGEPAAGVICNWEGPVVYDLSQVFQGEGFVFVRAQMRWEPCGATPGEQVRTYRIDPTTGTTSRLELLPNSAVAIPETASDPIELTIQGTNIRLRLLRSISGSVLSSTLKIGDVVDNTTGADLAPIEIGVVCQE